ncbi:DUF4911 domain-containing protein [Syntrophothermus sp.]|uniref:DUF4911 domain-containing protein n=1 Tax=Syntrophothermus sp. TaxID=2736299 RepID=UPI00257A7853|nr:DUF4911 domain-containing protein [Syntrophothermus sp.]
MTVVDPGDQVFLRVETQNIDFLNRIVEGWDGLGIVSTLDRDQGLVVIRVTPDTKPELLNVVRFLPFPAEVLDENPSILGS